MSSSGTPSTSSPATPVRGNSCAEPSSDCTPDNKHQFSITSEAVKLIAQAFGVTPNAAQNHLNRFYQVCNHQINDAVITGSAAIYFHWLQSSIVNKQEFKPQPPNDFDVIALSDGLFATLQHSPEVHKLNSLELSCIDSPEQTKTIALDALSVQCSLFQDTGPDFKAVVNQNTVRMNGLNVLSAPLLLHRIEKQLVQLQDDSAPEEKTARVKTRLKTLQELCKTNEEGTEFTKPNLTLVNQQPTVASGNSSQRKPVPTDGLLQLDGQPDSSTPAAPRRPQAVTRRLFQID